jgi:hypothetical protein
VKAPWVPWAVRRDGPASKKRGRRPEDRALVYHSVVGSLAAAFGVLDNTTNPDLDFVGFHGVLAKDGKLYQCYEMGEALNHAEGGRSWSIGIEVEGGPPGDEDEPWTEPQIETGARLLAWLLAEGWLPALNREGPNKTLYRHREVLGSSTACDSGRAPWGDLVQRASEPEEEDDVTKIIRIRDGRGNIVNIMVNGGVRKRCANEETAQKLIELGAQVLAFPGNTIWQLYRHATHDGGTIDLSRWP